MSRYTRVGVRAGPSFPARGKTGYVPHPRGPAGRNISPIGGLVLSIPTNLAPDRRELAWRATRWLTSPKIMKMFVQNGSVVSPRFSVSADPEVRSAFPLIAAVDRMAQLGQLQLWPRPPVREFNAIVAILGEHIHDMMQGLKTPKVALGCARSKWNDACPSDNRGWDVASRATPGVVTCKKAGTVVLSIHARTALPLL